MTASRSLGVGVALLITLASASFTSVANAEPTTAEKETARQLMDAARDRVDLKDYKGAAEIFKNADAIMHVPTTGFELARAQANAGMLVEAHETLVRVANLPQSPKEPEAFRTARKSASDLDQQLEKRIPTLRVEVKGAKSSSGFGLSIDHMSIKGAAAQSSHRLNPGHHVITAAIAGGAESKQEIDVVEGETKSVVLQLEQPTSSPQQQPTAEQQPPTTEPAHRTSPLAYIGLGTAGVGVIVGSVTGLLMFSKKSSLDDACTAEKLCPDSARADRDDAYTLATISTISFAVAGVGAVVGVVSLLSGGGKPSTTTARAKKTDTKSSQPLEPWLGVGTGGIRGTF